MQFYITHLEQFLIELSWHFTIGICSSAGDEYVSEIVSQIKPPGVNLFMVWSRSRCSRKRNLDTDDYYYEKSLHKLEKKGFSIEQIILVDDSPEKCVTNYGNSVYIKEFKGEEEDSELLHLLDYLITLKEVDNIRSLEKRTWTKRRFL